MFLLKPEKDHKIMAVSMCHAKHKDTPHLVRNIVAQVAAEESEVVMVPCEERGVLPDLDQSEVSTVVT